MVETTSTWNITGLLREGKRAVHWPLSFCLEGPLLLTFHWPNRVVYKGYKLDSKVAEKVESSPHPHRKGQLMVNNDTVGPESRGQGRSQ